MTTDPVETTKGILQVGQRVGYAPNNGMHRPAIIVGFGINQNQARCVFVAFDGADGKNYVDQARVFQLETDPEKLGDGVTGTWVREQEWGGVL